MGQVYRIIALFTTFACVFAIAPARAEGPRGQAGSPGDPAVLVSAPSASRAFLASRRTTSRRYSGVISRGAGDGTLVWVTAEPLVFLTRRLKAAGDGGQEPRAGNEHGARGASSRGRVRGKARPEVDTGGAWTAIIAFGEGTERGFAESLPRDLPFPRSREASLPPGSPPISPFPRLSILLVKIPASCTGASWRGHKKSRVRGRGHSPFGTRLRSRSSRWGKSRSSAPA
jgi:hypothetical protein